MIQRRLCAAALVLLMFQACDWFDRGNEPDPAPTCPPVGPAVLPLMAGTFGNYYANAQLEYLVVRDPVAWSFLYRWVTLYPIAGGVPGPEPFVDFTTDVVGAVLLGTQSAGGVSITLHDPADGRISVRFPSSGPPFMNRPYAFLNVPSSSGQLVFAECFSSQSGVVMDYTALADLDFQSQWNRPAADPAHIASLDAGVCPLDGVPLAVSALDFPGVTGTTHTACYCPTDGVYWVLYEGIGGVPLPPFRIWYGTFSPGFYPDPVPVPLPPGH